jgi:hypothetical protein
VAGQNRAGKQFVRERWGYVSAERGEPSFFEVAVAAYREWTACCPIAKKELMIQDFETLTKRTRRS